jgi:RNA polymerase sigma-70 factor (ECF subfamily)
LSRPEKRFAEAVLPHLDAAYNLARWIMRDNAEAEDMVQEACLRALRFIGGFRGGDGRLWLLKIVRNACYSRLAANRKHAQETAFDDDLHSPAAAASDAETLLLRSRDADAINRALEGLPTEFREVIVMREMEGLSYKAIADLAGVPIGTVMSRLARARRRMQQALGAKTPVEVAK